MGTTPKEEMVCTNCGWRNPDEAVFCIKCGSKLEINIVTERSRLEGLIILNITGSIYILLSAAFNSIIQVSLIFLALYLICGILGLYVAYTLYVRRTGKLIKALSSLTIALGFIGTFALFIIGLGARGVIGPAWVIFLVTGYEFWRKRHILTSSQT